MRKSTLFISATLTTFALVVMYGVVSAYQGNKKTAEVLATATVVDLQPTDTPAPTIITPEEAAQLAAQVVGHENLLSAETSNFNGTDAYLITFTNKDTVYVGLDGQILAVQVAPVYISQAPAPVKKNNNKNNNNNQNNNNGGGHESHDD